MISVNLIPETVMLAQARRRHAKGWLVSVLAAGALVAVPLTIDWLERARATKLRTRNDQLHTQLASIRADLGAVTARAHEALLQLERARVLRSKRPWSAIFVMIGECMPPGCWLTSVATDPATAPQGRQGAASFAQRRAGNGSISLGVSTSPLLRNGGAGARSTTVVIEAPRKLKITGYATRAAEPHQFVTNLKAAGAFDNVTLERSQREPALDGSYFRFELLCEW